MKKEETLLITGGTGLLGSALKKLLPQAQYPTKEELDIRNPELLKGYLDKRPVSQIVHAAAFMPPTKCENSPQDAIETNICGTAYLTIESIKRDIRLIYISTDYVYKGDQGNYTETDELLPINKYAWSKLGGECAAKLHKNAVIIRTSFGPEEFPYPKAFVDQWTSKEPVNIIAQKIVKVIEKENFQGIINLGGKRKTVYEYAQELKNEKHIGKIKRNELGTNYKVPKDTSLDTSKYRKEFK